jgi:hypothetical protein
MTWEEHLSPSSLSLENLEGLTEKVGTLGLQSLRKNRCGAAKKRAKKARLWRQRPTSAVSRQSATKLAEARYIWGSKKDKGEEKT